MKNRNLIIIILCLLFLKCATVNPDASLNDFSIELESMIKSHCQDVTVESLNRFLASKKNNDFEKDFLRFYVYCYSDDPILQKYIDNETVPKRTVNIYSLLLSANMAKDSAVSNYNIRKAKEIDKNNLYVLNEIYNFEKDEKNKRIYLNKMIEISPNNEFVLIHNIEAKRLNQDSLNYKILLNKLKNQYDNYYTNLVIANEYLSQAKIDSAVLFYKKSLGQKENINACVDISTLSLFYYKDLETADYYYQRAKQMEENNEGVLYVEAWLHFNKKDTLNARKSFDKLISINPSLENKKDYLLFLLSSNQIPKSKRYYDLNIKNLLSDEEKVGYFLTFEKLNIKNTIDLNNYFLKSDSVKNQYGIKPLDYTNKIVEAVLESIDNWR